MAKLVIERAQTDGSDAEWAGSVPEEPGKWNGTKPVEPLVGTWLTWVLESGDQFGPALRRPTTPSRWRKTSPN